MELVIGEAVARKNPKNAFGVYMEYMHGDADAYDEERIAVFAADTKTDKAGNSLDDCIGLMKRIEELNNQCYLRDAEDKLLSLPHYEDFIEYWPGDKTCDGQYPAGFDGWYIRYYDENGHEFEVNVRG
ncbi:hypothetical protein D3C87_796190 [compost metagenome]